MGNQECPILGEGQLVDAAHTGDDDLFVADVPLSTTQSGPSFPHRCTYLQPTPPEMLSKMRQSRDQDILDEKLVRLCQERMPSDPRPFRALVDRYRDQVINTAYRFLGNPHNAEDVAQEVFLKVYRGLSSFRAESSFSTWLYRITVNTCKNELRRRSRRPSLLEPDLESLGVLLPTTPSAEEVVIARQKRDAIQETLNCLSVTHREALILRDVQGLSYQEMAKVLGIGLSAAKMRVRRARLAFREIYR